MVEQGLSDRAACLDTGFSLQSLHPDVQVQAGQGFGHRSDKIQESERILPAIAASTSQNGGQSKGHALVRSVPFQLGKSAIYSQFI